MEIVDKDFILTPVKLSLGMFWDLKILVLVKSKTGEISKKFKNIAYAITLPRAIEYLAHYRCLCTMGNNSVKLEEFIAEYKKQCEKIENLCKNSIQTM